MNKTRIIALYLPQYHTIPENDEWWGKGFTDWVNVRKSKPRYWGHYQPHIPSELGYYDLLDENTRIAQAELAKNYGISGFCYYHYWFNGKMLLEKPFNEVLRSGKPDFPFCLCWANENWTRRWDGQDSEILMEQNYSEYDAREHMTWLSNAFSDKRYIKVNGKPMLLIYNVSGIQNIRNRIEEWRSLAAELIDKDIYLCSVKSIHNRLSDREVIELGFDAVVEFIPSSDKIIPRKMAGLPRYYIFKSINILIDLLGVNRYIKRLPLTIVHSYKKLVALYLKSKTFEVKTHPCVIPNWDNSARKMISATVQNHDPEIFKKWLRSSITKIENYDDDEKIVFINAWNEWAEGCHLEPDQKNGRKFLQAVSEVMNESN